MMVPCSEWVVGKPIGGHAWQTSAFRLCCGSLNRSRTTRVPNRLDEIRHEIALASRMLAFENVLDAFGHVSMRHPTDPGRYLLPRSRSPQLIEPDDILEYTLDSEPVKPLSLPMFAERVIHGCIYEARPDV